MLQIVTDSAQKHEDASWYQNLHVEKKSWRKAEIET
jgi:hypothetical protein